MATISIWPGSASFASENNPTPFGFYDTDDDFTSSADQVATWCAQRLGYPIVDIELQAVNFFTAFEESVTTYAQYVYQYEIIENMATLDGSETGSNLNNQYIQPNLGNIIAIGEQYGSEAGTGGSIDYKSGSIGVTKGQQVYKLNELFTNASESGNSIEIKRVYHYAPPAIVRYFDPYAGTGTGIQSLMETFGFGNFSPGVNFMLMPTYYDALKIQAIEFNDQIRKSAYSFELTNNNRIKLFPIPRRDETLYFEYVVKKDRNNPVRNPNAGLVTDVSNVPYSNITYNTINAPARQWIFRYTLALSKEMLSSIRGKYSTVPIPGSEITTNAAALRSEAAAEKTFLIEELKLMLEESSRAKYMEREKSIAQNTQDIMYKVPYPIYVY
jgi:hypothetical protein|tara:strand:+ start:812 stop:1966 length:1155 start_codon:yes stop_codon:yes gene_type:complete